MNEVTTVPPVASAHQGWLVYWAWFNYTTIGVILGFVVGSTLVAVMGKTFRPKRLCSKRLEWWWAMVPILIIIFLDIPNLVINYAREKNPFPVFGVKILGHQWYWEYELEYLKGEGLGLIQTIWYILEFCEVQIFNLVKFTINGRGKVLSIVIDFHTNFKVDSYEVKGAKGEAGMRFGDTDTRLVLPVERPCRLVCAGDDVIHNFNVKALGVSVDCVPGRLNQHKLEASNVGAFHGLCRELCGVNHPHIPCGVEILPYNIFLEWLGFINKLGWNQFYGPWLLTRCKLLSQLNLKREVADLKAKER